MSVEERLERLEKALSKILSRLESIEEKLSVLGLSDETISIATELVIAFSIPAAKAIEASNRVVQAIGRLATIDPISRSIVEALSDCREQSVSEITRRVRELRGTASRRIVRERLERLKRYGVVVRVGGKRPKYVLKPCIKG